MAKWNVIFLGGGDDDNDSKQVKLCKWETMMPIKMLIIKRVPSCVFSNGHLKVSTFLSGAKENIMGEAERRSEVRLGLLDLNLPTCSAMLIITNEEIQGTLR